MTSISKASHLNLRLQPAPHIKFTFGDSDETPKTDNEDSVKLVDPRDAELQRKLERSTPKEPEKDEPVLYQLDSEHSYPDPDDEAKRKKPD